MPGLSQTRAHLALVAIVALWGSYPAAAKLALADFPPFFLSAVRCALAACFLVVLLLRSSREPLPGLGSSLLRIFLVLGVTGIWGSTQLSYVALHYTTAGNAVILQAVAPVVVALMARGYLGERLRSTQQVGVAVSAVGVLLVVTSGRLAALQVEDLRAGDFLTLLSLVGWSVS